MEQQLCYSGLEHNNDSKLCTGNTNLVAFGFAEAGSGRLLGRLKPGTQH